MLWKTLQYDYKQPADELFLAAGLDPTQINNPNYRYADEKLQVLWKLVLEKTQDECIGLKVALHIHPTTLNALGFAWLSSTTLLDALERLVRFYHIVTDVEKLKLQEHADHYCLRQELVDNTAVVIDQDYDTFFAAIYVMCQAICGEPYQFSYLNMKRPAPDCMDKMEQFFAVPIHFFNEYNEIWFKKESITDSLPTANAKLARENDQIMHQYLSKLDKENIVMQVKTHLIDKLSSGTINEQEMANLLHMSLRTLQRKLKDSDSNYKEILDETRRHLAVEFVREAKTPMIEITFLLGYSEQANFTRAFKRWTGQSPSEFRNAS